MTNSKGLTTKDRVDALLAFYASIEFVSDEKQVEDAKRQGRSWRIEYIQGRQVFAFIDDEKLGIAADKIWACAKIADKFARNTIVGRIANYFYAVKLDKAVNVQRLAEAFLERLWAEPPVVVKVYMEMFGAHVKNGNIQKGDFTFMPAGGFDALGIKEIVPGSLLQIKERIWGNVSHVAVSVLACDVEKARELAAVEFKWLENAVRLFINTRYLDLGITSQSSVYVENALAIGANGMLGASSNVRGPSDEMVLDDVFARNPHVNVVLETLGRKSDSLTRLQSRIRQAVYLGGLSTRAADDAIAYFLCVSALEAIFVADRDRYVNPSIANQIIEAFCYLIGDDDEKRIVYEQMHGFYEKRSAVAHGGDKKISKEDVRVAQQYLRAAVVKLLNDPVLSKVPTVEELGELVKDRKFGRKQQKGGI